MVITFDGIAGAGKSSLAKELANRIGFTFCSAGAIYRAIALKTLNLKISPTDYDSLKEMLEDTNIYLKNENGECKVFLDGKDVTSNVYTPIVSEFTPHIAKIPFLRKFVRSIQYKMAENENIIVEGRDIGTVVFPNAELKFFVTVSDDVRAKRRQMEYLNKGENISFEECLKLVRERDKEDMEREVSPLARPDDAIDFINDYPTFEIAADELTKFVRNKLNLK